MFFYSHVIKRNINGKSQTDKGVLVIKVRNEFSHDKHFTDI